MKKEHLIAILIAGVVLLLSNAYLVSGVLQPKDGLVYLGRHVTNSQDTYTYVAFIEQARQGRILFENLYTTEPQTTTLIRPSYTVLGFLARVLGISSISAYHVGRILFSILFFFVIYVFIGQFFHTPKKRLLAFTIMLISSGLGAFIGGIFPDSADLWIPESNTFLSLQEAPHFILSNTLMVLSFLFLVKGWGAFDRLQKRWWKYFVFLGILLLYLGFEHPYDLVSITVTTVIASAWMIYTRIKKIISEKNSQDLGIKALHATAIIYGLGIVIGVNLLAYLYQYIETISNPILGSWAAQSTSPIPFDFLIGYGLLVLFSLFGMERYLTERKPIHILILAWVAATSLLLYIPVFFQRRLSGGFHIPIAILGTEGVIICALFISSFVLQKARRGVYVAFVGLAVLLMGTGTVIGVFKDIETVKNDTLDNYYYYLLPQEIHGMEWIRSHTTQKDAILTNWFYGNILPGVAGRKVYVGHKAQTKNFDKKVSFENKFLLEKNPDKAYKFLQDNGITYVYLGKNDTILRYSFKPDEKPYLIKVFDEGGARVYRVR